MNYSGITGNVKTITFNEFLTHLSHAKGFNPQKPKIYDTLISFESIGCPDVRFEGNTTDYLRCATGWCQTNDGLKNSVINQCRVFNQYMKNPHELVKDVLLRYLEDFGTPQFFVQIAPRLYLIVNTKDWKVYLSTDGKRAICGTARIRNHLINVERMTEVDRDKIAKKYLDNQKQG